MYLHLSRRIYAPCRFLSSINSLYIIFVVTSIFMSMNQYPGTQNAIVYVQICVLYLTMHWLNAKLPFLVKWPIFKIKFNLGDNIVSTCLTSALISKTLPSSNL